MQISAYDTYDNEWLDLGLEKLVNARVCFLGSDKGTARAGPGLPDTVELALGMAV